MLLLRYIAAIYSIFAVHVLFPYWEDVKDVKDNAVILKDKSFMVF